ncbi:hypothetical protein DFH08DRAFT_818591 [Mycena albidolilacea]|uniref:Uncharacterized protein n=1 Tax=Mycena albidolilacea TaxID=1033008 RepID=A0AAD6ZFK2_9AGAR|nr:hypothetical protein DFH08DRAFT_818591 [Mycena albidolilacea]
MFGVWVWHVWWSGTGLAVWDVAILWIGKNFRNTVGPQFGLKMKAIKLEAVEILPSRFNLRFINGVIDGWMVAIFANSGPSRHQVLQFSPLKHFYFEGLHQGPISQDPCLKPLLLKLSKLICSANPWLHLNNGSRSSSKPEIQSQVASETQIDFLGICVKISAVKIGDIKVHEYSKRNVRGPIGVQYARSPHNPAHLQILRVASAECVVMLFGSPAPNANQPQIMEDIKNSSTAPLHLVLALGVRTKSAALRTNLYGHTGSGDSQTPLVLALAKALGAVSYPKMVGI